MDSDQKLNSTKDVTAGAESSDSNTGDLTELFAQPLPPVSKTVDDYQDNPEPEPEKVPDEEGAAKVEPDDARGTLDKKGNPFDPALHRYPPEMTPTGRWKKRPKKELDNEKENGEPGIDANYKTRLEAQKMAAVYSGMHIAVFGQDGTATPEMQGFLVDGFENFFHHNGAVEIPPGIDLLLVCGTYTGQIVSRPSNWEKCKKFCGGLVKRWKEWRIKRA